MQTTNDWGTPARELAESGHLLKRFDEDIQTVYHHMKILEIVFENLKHSWTAISLVHRVIQVHEKDKN
jgi:hypothetical protein